MWDIGASVGGRFASEEKSCFTGDFLEWLYFDIASGAMGISTTAHNEELKAMWYYVVLAYKLMLNI